MELFIALFGILVSLIAILITVFYGNQSIGSVFHKFPILSTIAGILDYSSSEEEQVFDVRSIINNASFKKTYENNVGVHTASFETVKKELNDDHNNNLQIILTKVFLNRINKIKKYSSFNIITFILREMGGHAAYLRATEFENLAIPLENGLIAYITRNADKLIVDDIEMHDLNNRDESLWNVCMSNYVRCRNFTHRHTSTREEMFNIFSNIYYRIEVISRILDLSRSIDLLIIGQAGRANHQKMRFAVEKSISNLKATNETLLRRKQFMQDSEFEKSIEQLIVDAEAVISFAHKVIFGSSVLRNSSFRYPDDSFRSKN